jgi:hypothetical protein
MASYKPTFHMPVIDNSAPFASVTAATTVTASKPGRYAVDVAVSNPAYRQVFTMAGGVVRFIPEGKDPFSVFTKYKELPALKAGTGYLHQRIWPADVNKLRGLLPEGVPPMASILYLNVDPADLPAVLSPYVKKASLSVLKSYGTIAGSSGRSQYEKQFVDKFLLGEVGLFLPGGTKVGKMASANLTLFCIGGDKWGLSPIPYFRSMPTLAGAGWAGHPLIDAVKDLEVPVDIYAQFATAVGGVPKPLPSGTNVRLRDYNPVLANETLAIASTIGGGRVEFRTTDLQLQTAIDGTTESRPDLFFEMDLGTHNPEPQVLTDPWKSDSVNTFGPNPGYFEDFAGTRLGSQTHPLLYHIGLGFWQYLISFRSPAAVQLDLKKANRQPQPIEKSFEGWWRDTWSGNLYYAYSPLSLDYYAVRVDALPAGYPTAEDLILGVRRHADYFLNTSNSIFKPDDLPRWESADALGVVLNIDFYLGANFDSGSVVVGQCDPTGWTVHTIWDPEDLGHPLGGIRRWGFVTNSDGSHTFFTQGADRPWSALDYANRTLVFWGADTLWRNYQKQLKTFIDSRGGSATIVPPVVNRFEWPRVAPLYWKPDPANPWI